jgi:type IV fimbrial biogenesis protein FimT
MNVRIPRSLHRGLTLVELCTVMAIGSILVGTAAPSFDGYRNRRSLDGTAAETLTDIHYARSEAVARNTGVRVSFLNAPDGARCIAVHTGNTADCSCGVGGVAQCSADAVLLKAQSLPVGHPVAVSANVGSMRVDPLRGNVAPSGTIRLGLASGAEVQHVVSTLGRVRSCSPQGKVVGYKPC